MRKLTSLLLLLACALPVQAQTYPARIVKIVVPFPAGGPVDTFTRQLAQKLSDAMGDRKSVV